MSDIDYERRYELLTEKMTVWLAQMEWERSTGISLTAWDKAIMHALATPDGPHLPGIRADSQTLLSQAAKLLADAQKLLRPGADRFAQLQLRAAIERFSRNLC